jgi:hypothetical protein
VIDPGPVRAPSKRKHTKHRRTKKNEEGNVWGGGEAYDNEGSDGRQLVALGQLAADLLGHGDDLVEQLLRRVDLQPYLLHCQARPHHHHHRQPAGQARAEEFQKWRD